MLQDRVAVVTGGARGIGRAIVLGLAQAGADVAVVDLVPPEDMHELAEAVRGYGGLCEGFQADVACHATAIDVVTRIVAQWGRVDILINNAGIMKNSPIWDLDELSWDRVMDVDLKGAFNYVRAVAPYFRAQRYGRVVNISSIHGLRGRESGSNYSAAKAGLIGLTKSVARDLGPYSVTVNAVAPGTTETDMILSLPTDVREKLLAEVVLGRLGQPEDVAHLVVFLCSEKARHITGEVIKVDGGQYI